MANLEETPGVPNPEDVVYTGDNFHLLRAIIATITRLPIDVQRFALDRCCFLSVGAGTAGVTLPGRVALHPFEQTVENMWIIQLDESLDESDAHGVTAHEIAHAWHQHDRLGLIPEDAEIVACEQARAWGFTGQGADWRAYGDPDKVGPDRRGSETDQEYRSRREQWLRDRGL